MAEIKEIIDTTVTVQDGDVTVTEVVTPAKKPTKIAIIGKAAAVGRRKEAVARVRLFPGNGNWSINGKNLEGYFPNKVHQQLVNSPLVLVGQESRYDVIVNVRGGGTSGQAGATRLGVSRALNEIDREANRAPLKSAGFLSRDARAVERKKAGLKKARKASQFSKR
jgi:small subunit ribosomal protein S9